MVRSFSSRTTGVMAAVACGLMLAALPAVSQSSAKRVDIPAQALSKSLLEFSRQSGVNIVVDPGVVAGKAAPAVNGEFTVEATLERLLAGSGLTAERSSDNTVLIKPRVLQTSEVLETINVFGTLENQVSVGSKTGLSLRETPKSITIVTRDRIEAQNLSTIAGVMKQATGVTVRDYGPFGGWFFSRGYRVITSQVDGGAPITDGFGNIASPDSAMFDSVEVLRGVDGLFSGAGDPGGVINLVRKRASSTPGLQINTSAGRWDNYRVEADLTGPLALDGRVRGRTVGVYEDRGYHWDRASTKKALLYGVLETDIGSSTLLSVGGSYEHGNHRAMDLSGLPFYSDGRSLNLPRDTNFASDWSYMKVTTKEVFAKAEHTFANDIVMKMNVSHQEQDTESLSLFVRGPVNTATGIIAGTGATGVTASATEYQPKRTALDLFVKGKFRLFSQEHSFAVGADYSKMNGDHERWYSFADYPTWASARRPLDVFNFDPSLFAAPTGRQPNYFVPVSNQTQSGMYATLGLQLAEPLRLIAGARYSNYEVQSVTYYADAAGVLPSQPSYGSNYKEHALIPSVALTYEMNQNWSTYASYAQSFTPQAQLLTAPVPGSPMSAISGKGFELGVKGTAFEGLNASLAIYRVLRSGEGIQDPAYPFTPGELGAACCYVSSGDVTTQGLDLEFSGRILPGWQLFAGYTYSERESNKASVDDFTGTSLYLNWTPKHLFKAWTTWNLPGSLSKWTLNAGVQAQSEFSGYGFPTPLPRQGGYAIWNASVQYRMNDSWSAALYAENLLDKTYYEAMSTVRNEGLYGVPRNLILRMQYKF